MVGFGYDSHRFEQNGKLIIGGIVVSNEIGVVAHSDGDVALHALIDALLGAASLGDIGELFPDNDPLYKGIDSTILLKKVVDLIAPKQLQIMNIDITIVLEKPKLKDFKDLIKSRIAEICNINIEKVNIKAKTNEKMGFIGRNEGLACFCVCQLESILTSKNV